MQITLPLIISITAVTKLFSAKKPQKTTSNVLTCICLIVFSASAASAENKITFYRDGALIQQEAGGVKGVVELPLADGLLENSLNIVPAPGTSILAVEVRKTAQRSKSDKELETLFEQRRRFDDRLQALATREEIFKAAAKSQSGKAPRKTKANPDPMQAIRQGTDFAIAQLEAVYTARRKTEQEIRKVDGQIASTKKSGRAAESGVHIIVTPARGRVTLRYATSERGWQPQYNLYVTGSGTALLQLSARIAGSSGGYRTLVSSGSIADSAPAAALTLPAGSTTPLSYKLPLVDERFGDGIFKQFSGRITNTGTEYLPPGDSGLFRSGAYLGRFRFEGLSSGRSRVISFGK